MGDYLQHSRIECDLEENQAKSLCCCEYYDRSHRRYNILGCCCDCEDFDRVFTDWITCASINSNQRHSMLLTFQDRLRIPWRGGAKQVTLETILPIFVLPLLISLAALNAYTCTVLFLASGGAICYGYHCVQRAQVRTRFFSMWLFWSLVYIFVLFETTVSLLEMLPEENLFLVFLTMTSLFCFYRTRLRASMNFVVQSTVGEDELPDIAEASATEEEEEALHTTLLLDHVNENEPPDVTGHQPNICSTCRKCVPARTAHCVVCGACILKRDHHSYWLNCCVGKWNHGFYVAGLFFAMLALLLGADLTLTAVCHPFQFFDSAFLTILLPDDCSEVFDIYELGIAFVIGLYALIMAFYAFFMLVRQIYLISRGITLHECQHGFSYGNKKHIKQNWKSFVT